MAIHRGIQSAVFFYLSCAPCAEARYRRNRKAEAERGRLERNLLESQMPHHYRQPSPSSTNPHWQSEIDAGPHLSARGKKRTAANGPESQRGLHTTMSATDSNGSNVPSSVDLPARLDSRGSNDPARFHATSAGNTITPPQKARLREQPSRDSFRSYRHPQVNDLHPAVVTDIGSRAEAAWLMEPPPIAEVMSGKDRMGRVRSDSNSSRPSARSIPVTSPLSSGLAQRQMGVGGSHASLALTREQTSSSRSGGPSTGAQEQGLAMPTGKESHMTSYSIRLSETSSHSTGTVIHQPILSPEPAQHLALPTQISRPGLSTIHSESNFLGLSNAPPSTSPKENNEPLHNNEEHSSEQRDRIARRPGVVVRDSSIKVLQELAPKSKILNAQIYTSGSTTAESEIELPASDEDESRQLNSGAELFYSWYTPDFQLDTWIHEHTKREVRQRWSMDI